MKPQLTLSASFCLLLFVGCGSVNKPTARSSSGDATLPPRVVMLPVSCTSTASACEQGYARELSRTVANQLTYAGSTVLYADELLEDAREDAAAPAALRALAGKFAAMKSRKERGEAYRALGAEDRALLLTAGRANGFLNTKLNVSADDPSDAVDGRTSTVSLRIEGADSAQLVWQASCAQAARTGMPLQRAVDEAALCALFPLTGRNTK